jgi:hypothetical protein
MNNIVDDDDDIMDFLIHNEDDKFTEAIVLIVDNLAKEAYDGDNIPLVPPFVWGSGSCVGKAPNIERRRRVFNSHLLFDDYFGPSPIKTHLTSRSSSRCQLDCLMTSWQR